MCRAHARPWPHGALMFGCPGFAAAVTVLASVHDDAAAAADRPRSPAAGSRRPPSPAGAGATLTGPQPGRPDRAPAVWPAAGLGQSAVHGKRFADRRDAGRALGAALTEGAAG